MHFDILVEHVPTPVRGRRAGAGFREMIKNGICCLFENYPFEVFDGKIMDHNQTIVTEMIHSGDTHRVGIREKWVQSVHSSIDLLWFW